ncbi:MAG: DUF1643 domain-containing protein [Clostridium sp.]|uniref:DUF1643 domain-containing protein n=1 Tax=Clostridium sp. TaxID=1506 RepID=UPI002FC6B124
MCKVRGKSINIEECYDIDGEQEYRYLLTRWWDKGDKEVTVIMCNPSKASSLCEDRTVMNLNSFLAAKGYNKIKILNLFAFKNTKVEELKNRNNIFELKNDEIMRETLLNSKLIVVAWGYGKENKKSYILNKILDVKDILLQCKCKVECFADEKGNKNVHPLLLDRGEFFLTNYFNN